jgi:hypothetical protein
MVTVNDPAATLGVTKVHVSTVFRTFLVVLGRACLALCIWVPVFLVQAISGTYFFGYSYLSFILNISFTLGLVAWVLLPLVHLNVVCGVALAVFWLTLAVTHVTAVYWKLNFITAIPWAIATLFLVVTLKANPPSYFPQRWARK